MTIDLSPEGQNKPGPDVYLFAAEANAELDALRREYVELLLRYDAALIKHLDLEAAYDALLAKYRATASALSRTLEVLANLQQAWEKKHAISLVQN